MHGKGNDHGGIGHPAIPIPVDQDDVDPDGHTQLDIMSYCQTLLRKKLW